MSDESQRQQSLFPSSTSCAAGSPAKTSASQATAQASSTEPAPDCGENSDESSKRSDPSQSSSRTSPGSERRGSKSSSGILPARGMMLRGTFSPLPTSARLTLDVECGSPRGEMLPTPTASSYGSSQNGDPGDGRGRFAQAGKPSLETLAKMGKLPTPVRMDSARAGNRIASDKAHPGVSLTDVVVHGRSLTKTQAHLVDVMLPTPTARLGDKRRSMPSPRLGQARLDEGRRNLDDAISVLNPQGGSLNPRFVEWMMGVPLGWTSRGACLPGFDPDEG